MVLLQDVNAVYDLQYAEQFYGRGNYAGVKKALNNKKNPNLENSGMVHVQKWLIQEFDEIKDPVLLRAPSLITMNKDIDMESVVIDMGTLKKESSNKVMSRSSSRHKEGVDISLNAENNQIYPNKRRNSNDLQIVSPYTSLEYAGASTKTINDSIMTVLESWQEVNDSRLDLLTAYWHVGKPIQNNSKENTSLHPEFDTFVQIFRNFLNKKGKDVIQDQQIGFKLLQEINEEENDLPRNLTSHGTYWLAKYYQNHENNEVLFKKYLLDAVQSKHEQAIAEASKLNILEEDTNSFLRSCDNVWCIVPKSLADCWGFGPTPRHWWKCNMFICGFTTKLNLNTSINFLIQGTDNLLTLFKKGLIGIGALATTAAIGLNMYIIISHSDGLQPLQQGLQWGGVALVGIGIAKSVGDINRNQRELKESLVTEV